MSFRFAIVSTVILSGCAHSQAPVPWDDPNYVLLLQTGLEAQALQAVSTPKADDELSERSLVVTADAAFHVATGSEAMDVDAETEDVDGAAIGRRRTQGVRDSANDGIKPEIASQNFSTDAVLPGWGEFPDAGPRQFTLYYNAKSLYNRALLLARFTSWSQVDELMQNAVRRGFNMLLVYSNAYGPGANATAPETDPHDMMYVRAALNTTQRMIHYDVRRVYCIGLSKGGRFCSRVGSELSELIAAIAPVSGLRYPYPNNASRPMPVIATHGTGDFTNPYVGGGPWYWQTSVPDAIFAGWSPFNGCTGSFESPMYNNTAVRQVHWGCRADVQLVSIQGGGHGWPYPNNTSLRAQWWDDIYEFLLAHPMPEAVFNNA